MDDEHKEMADALIRIFIKTRSVPMSVLFRKYRNDPSAAVNVALKTIAGILSKRRDARYAKRMLEESRMGRLEKALGSRSRYNEVLDLVGEISTLRYERAGATCNSRECRLRREQQDPSTQQRQEKEIRETIPSPVRQLFFYNELDRVVTTADPATFRDLDWDGMIERARLEVAEYREWAGIPKVEFVVEDIDDELLNAYLTPPRPVKGTRTA